MKINGPIILLFIYLLSGCNSANVKSYFNEEPIKTETINYEYNEEKTFTFDSVVPKDEILINLSKASLNHTAFKKIINWLDGFKKITSSTDDSNLFITYSHGEIVNSNKKNKYSTSYTKINIPLKISYINNTTQVTIKAPEKAINVVSAGKLFMTIEPYTELTKIKDDAYKIYNNIKPNKLKRQITETIDIKSKYPAKSIASNFKRMTLCNIEISKAFTCHINNNKTTIEIHPYKNGSRITAWIYVDYYLNSDGTSTINQSKEIMSGVKKKINIIINN